MQRSGSGWFETLLNSHTNVSSNGEIFSVKERRNNVSSILSTLDRVYNLDMFTSASKNQCTAAVGFKWMLNQEKVEAKIVVDPILSNPDIDPLESSRKVDDYYMDIVGGVKKRRIYGLGNLGSSQTSIGMTYVDVERIRAEGRAEVQQVLDDVVARQTQMEETIRTLMARFNASDSNLPRDS